VQVAHSNIKERRMSMKVTRTERTIISETHPHYKLLKDFCHESKNLYNYGNYILRQKWNEKDWDWFSKYGLRDYLRKNQETEGNPWNRQSTSHAAAETILSLTNAWKAYFSSVKSYNKTPEKFKARPKPPSYLPKNGHYIITLDTTNAKVKDGFVKFPKTYNGLTIPFTKADKIQCVRIVPHWNNITIEVVYLLDVPEAKPDNGRYLSIDIGIDNFATITSNIVGFQSLVLNGKGLKSINQYYNKQKAYYQSIADSQGQRKQTDRLQRLTEKRNRQINDFMHKASNYVAELAQQGDVSHVVIGYNAGWKNEVNIGRINNQKFVNIPHLSFINKLRYKLENIGIELVVTEESYTSKSSFLSGEFPDKKPQYSGERKYRGLYIDKSGIKINADCNGSYQILKKVFPDAYSNGIVGVSLHPVKVSVSDVRKGRKALA